MADSLHHAPFLPFSDFYGEWTKTLTHTCLPLLQESLSPAALTSELSATNTKLVLGHLNLYAKTEPNTIPHLLFPSWPNSLELPTLFLGDIHPYLLTSLVRSFIKRANQDSGETSLEMAAWKDSSDKLMTSIESIEGKIGLAIPGLWEKMNEAQIRFMARFSDHWVSSNHSQEEQQNKTVMDMAALVAMDEAAKEEMKEFENIFVRANVLRKQVISDIVEATSDHQAALFLEGLCQFFAGFKDLVLLQDFESLSHGAYRYLRLGHHLRNMISCRR